MEDVYMRQASDSDFNAIWAIILDAKLLMAESGRTQWNDKYPDKWCVQQDIDRKKAYVLCYREEIVVYGVILLNGEPEYDNLKKGQWLTKSDYYVVHRLAVSKKFRGLGLAMFFLNNVEKIAQRTGVKSIRVDTKNDNVQMLSILIKCGFHHCGTVSYPVNGDREVFEKVIY